MPRKKTQSEHIADFRAVHGMRYDYSNVDYVNAITKVVIVCHEHGNFEQPPANHKKGQGCPKCGGGVKKTQCEVIADLQAVHGGRYGYEKVDYTNARTKVTIVCPEHGDFEQATTIHVRGAGCPRCAGNARKARCEHIAEFRDAHGDRYDYSNVDYVNAATKVTIGCPEHGDFEQVPTIHKSGSGCPKCAGNEMKTRIEVIADFRAVHGDVYDYSKVDYINTNTKVTIVCHEHGDFEQSPTNHKSGCGCPKCSQNRGEGIVYLIEITKPGGESFVKIGWTARGVEERFKADDFTVTLLDFATFENATAGEAFERSMHTSLSHHKYIPTEKFGGWTECFDINAKDDIIREFNLAIEQN